MVRMFSQISEELRHDAGGKGGMLSKMSNLGLPVPEGFVIFPDSFDKDGLRPSDQQQVLIFLRNLREAEESKFAVRSSALSEDSASASFAGEFETVLNTQTDEEILAAIAKVTESGNSARVESYSKAKGFDGVHQIAVVVQKMVDAQISGVLFTADPITGSHAKMIGNAVYGLGEQLVSGESNAMEFSLQRPHGTYQGPGAVRGCAKQLYKIAQRLHELEGCPQDIEWAVEKGKLYLLQSRPITTLNTVNWDTYEINESVDRDYMWTNFNVGEAIPDVMTPFTWSLIRELDLETTKMTGYYIWSGNIYGRVYTNISIVTSFLSALGIPQKTGFKLIEDAFGNAPKGIEVPRYPMSTGYALRELSYRAKKNIKRMQNAMKQRDYYLQHTKQWCAESEKQIRELSTQQELAILWEREIRPYVSIMWDIFLGGASGAVRLMTLRKKLIQLVGEEQTGELLSNMRAQSGLESLGPLLGIARVIQDEMTAEQYMQAFGHRSPHEFEVYYPYPKDEAGWMDRQIALCKELSPENLLRTQQERSQKAVMAFGKRYPGKMVWLQKELEAASKYAQIREAIRSEFVRIFRIIRLALLKLGEFTSIGDGVFFLYVHEILPLLKGDTSMLKFIELRRKNYEKYCALPPLPPFVRGRFDLQTWQESVNRTFYDATKPSAEIPQGDVLKGFSGAAGRVEGIVRILRSFEEGEKLQKGEILVASTTNVGWTQLFPKAAAIVTDIGAPLSHAAIVARELGIPAVVGCNIATTRLKDGDRVIVDGGRGTVQLL